MVETNPQQITLSTTVVKIVDQDQRRTSLTLANLDSSITIYYGYKSGITATRDSFPLVAGETITILLAFGEDPRRTIYAVAASGTPIIAIKEDGSDELLAIVKREGVGNAL